MQLGPAGDLLIVRVEELPSERGSHSKPAVIRGAPPDANDASFGSFGIRREQHFAEPARVQFEWVIFPWRELRETHDERGFNDRRSRWCVPPPFRFAGAVRRVHRLD